MRLRDHPSTFGDTSTVAKAAIAAPTAAKSPKWCTHLVGVNIRKNIVRKMTPIRPPGRPASHTGNALAPQHDEHRREQRQRGDRRSRTGATAIRPRSAGTGSNTAGFRCTTPDSGRSRCESWWPPTRLRSSGRRRPRSARRCPRPAAGPPAATCRRRGAAAPGCVARDGRPRADAATAISPVGWIPSVNAAVMTPARRVSSGPR